MNTYSSPQLDKKNEEMRSYKIGIMSNEGFFTVLTIKEFKTMEDAYKYGRENIHINNCKGYFVHVQLLRR